MEIALHAIHQDLLYSQMVIYLHAPTLFRIVLDMVYRAVLNAKGVLI